MWEKNHFILKFPITAASLIQYIIEKLLTGILFINFTIVYIYNIYNKI